MPQNKETNPKKLIFEALAKNQKLEWHELWQKTGLSKSAFCTHLNKLVRYGIVEKTIDAFRNPPRTIYTLNPTKQLGFSSIFLTEKPISKAIASLKEDLEKAESEKEKERLFKNFLGYSLLLLLAENLVSLYSALQIAKKLENVKEAEELFNYLQRNTLKIENEILGFCLAYPQYWDLISKAINENVWIAHLLEEEEGELYQALEMLLSKLQSLNIKKC
jgi:DNA-binding transcriptional regulator GbsR (MarR family)